LKPLNQADSAIIKEKLEKLTFRLYLGRRYGIKVIHQTGNLTPTEKKKTSYQLAAKAEHANFHQNFDWVRRGVQPLRT